MNRVPRLPLPTATYYVHVRYPAILGGDDETRGPFATGREARRAAGAMAAPYPGHYGPSVRIERREATDAR
jgi:hypothetical protein